MLELDDKDLKAIANSRADRGRRFVLAGNVFGIVVLVWFLAIMGIALYLYFASGTPQAGMLNNYIVNRMFASLGVFVVIVFFTYLVISKIKSNRIFKELKKANEKK